MVVARLMCTSCYPKNKRNFRFHKKSVKLGFHIVVIRSPPSAMEGLQQLQIYRNILCYCFNCHPRWLPTTYNYMKTRLVRGSDLSLSVGDTHCHAVGTAYRLPTIGRRPSIVEIRGPGCRISIVNIGTTQCSHNIQFSSIRNKNSCLSFWLPMVNNWRPIGHVTFIIWDSNNCKIVPYVGVVP